MVDIPELIRGAVANPRLGCEVLATEIRAALKEDDVATARPLAYALMGLSIEGGFANETFSDAVGWLLRIETTQLTTAAGILRFAEMAGDRALEKSASAFLGVE